KCNGTYLSIFFFFFFSSRRRHTRFSRDWSSDVCSSDLAVGIQKWVDDTLKKFKIQTGNSVQATLMSTDNVIPQFTNAAAAGHPRSEERRVGKECRSRWSR